MNRIKLITVLIFIVPNIIFSQESERVRVESEKGTTTIKMIDFEGTTLDEFLYCTKGYKDQVEKGLDPGKNGYILKELDQSYDVYFNTGKRMKIVGLYKEDSKKLKAIIFVINPDKEKKDVFCFITQHTTADVMKRYKQQFSYDSYKQEITMVLFAMNEFITSELNKSLNN